MSLILWDNSAYLSQWLILSCWWTVLSEQLWMLVCLFNKMHIKLLKEQCFCEQLWMLIFAEINFSWIFWVKCTQLLKVLVCLIDVYQAVITVLISLKSDLSWTSIISNTARAEFTVNLKSLQTQLLHTLEVCTFSEKLLANLNS